MTTFNRHAHWEAIYQSKPFHECGWYQSIPATSLSYLEQLSLPKNAPIIDIGAGDSYLVDHLLKAGYTDVTVLDISESAILRAKERLKEKAARVTWIVADAASYHHPGTYSVWHDRAAFHFLTAEKDQLVYLKNMRSAVKPGGYAIMGTFSEKGPTRCSGIDIHQYSEESLSGLLQVDFEKMQCEYIDHITPGGAIQNYLFCCFKRIQ